MKNYPRFVDELASYLLDKTTDTVVVVPSKRAKVFLIDALAQQSERLLFAPAIISIEEFVQQLSGFQPLDPIDAVFEFYQVYLANTPEEERQDFEAFSMWAPILLQDFNEIDRYLLDANSILDYLKAIEDIKHWSVDPEQQTDLIQRYLVFWNRLNRYYHAFAETLSAQKIGYQGLIYRQAVNQLADFVSTTTNRTYCFAGFNALNAAEERIVQQLQANGLAEIFWDIDRYFLNHPQHDAGLFLRRYKQNWPMYRTRAFEKVHDYYTAPKNIQIFGTPKAIGQAKLVGAKVKELLANGKSPSDIAIVLGEEKLLLPVLHALPKEVSNLNITMGYSAKNSPVQIVFGKLIKMHMHALQRKGVLYYRELLDVLGHPLIEPLLRTQDLRKYLQQNNVTFVRPAKVLEELKDATGLAERLFGQWPDSVKDVIDQLLELLQQLKQIYQTQFASESLTQTFLYAQYQVLTRLKNHLSAYEVEVSWNSFYGLYKQLASLGEVSFEGEPLQGLQIMGVLESRLLDFDTVIVTSLNEGVFPAGKGGQSFIPQDVKFEYNLPTYKEKDAIYTYHFYHLLQRSNSVYLIYNTESDGLGGGEPSRFLTQLRHEKRPNHTITEQIITASVPPRPRTEMSVEKTPRVMEVLQKFSERISPSSLTSYMRNPFQFYLERVLKIKEVEEVEEVIEANTLGTIIHLSLENLYKPHLNQELKSHVLTDMLNAHEEVVKEAFKSIYKEGNIKEGKNLLACEVAIRYVKNFLQQELADIEQGHRITVLGLEQQAARQLILRDGREVTLIGNIDRIERRLLPDANGNYQAEIRIVDYKSGKVEDKNLTVKDWSGLIDDIKWEKAIQVLCYAYMLYPQYGAEPMRVGIISFKNLKRGFMGLKLEKEEVYIDAAIIAAFTEQISRLIEEILNPEIPFNEVRKIETTAVS